MKNKSNKPERNQKEASGAQQAPAPKTAGEKTETQKPKAESGEKWKHPDPTIPERKHNPDPTKPEKEEGPKAPATAAAKTSAPPMKNPGHTELKSGEGVGEFVERDIEQQGITGEEKEEEGDLEEEEEQMSPGIQRPQAESRLSSDKDQEQQDEEEIKKSA